jgi:hypothetical protein
MPYHVTKGAQLWEVKLLHIQSVESMASQLDQIHILQ